MNIEARPGYAPPSMRRQPAAGQRGLGDVVHAGLKPFVVAIDKAAGTNLQHCGGCKRRRETLNKIKLP
jgi:hypothetical protein